MLALVAQNPAAARQTLPVVALAAEPADPARADAGHEHPVARSARVNPLASFYDRANRLVAQDPAAGHERERGAVHALPDVAPKISRVAATAERVNGYADTLDDVIRKIRTSIFGLQQPSQAHASLHARLIEIIEEHASQLGFAASIRLSGTLGRTRRSPMTSWPSPARRCPTAPAMPEPPRSASPWHARTG
jgi:hypothetical protein